MDYIHVAPGLVVDEDGVIIETASIDDAMKFVAQSRHEAKEQEKEWGARVQVLDRVLLRNQSEKKLTYGDLVVSIRGGTYSKTDAEQFAALVYEKPVELEDLFAVIAAASGFKKDLLPESVREAYEATTTTFEKRSWIESNVARKRAPAMEKQEAE